jgi:hypothetical protein
MTKSFRVLALTVGTLLALAVAAVAQPTASPSASPAGCVWQGVNYPEGTLGSVDCNGSTCSAIVCKNGSWAAPNTTSPAGPGKCFVDSDCPPKLSAS